MTKKKKFMYGGIICAIIGVLLFLNATHQPGFGMFGTSYKLKSQRITIGENKPAYGTATLSTINGIDHLIVRLAGYSTPVYNSDVSLDQRTISLGPYMFGGVSHYLFIYVTPQGFDERGGYEIN